MSGESGTFARSLPSAHPAQSPTPYDASGFYKFSAAQVGVLRSDVIIWDFPRFWYCHKRHVSYPS
ncbi:MAG: hypothetical protein CME25_00770 [Gemmatimonadetes bacterium]|nr:hypothetical protein [Gemmatimonadota bacterium]